MKPAIVELITTAFVGGASDVFLVEGERPRVRTNGEVVIAHGNETDRESIAEIWRACGMEPDKDKDGDVSLVVEGAGRLRMNAYQTLGRLAMVLRPIKEDAPSFEELGLPGELLKQWVSRRSGLIIITGPTGSGKSTTVAACLDWINRNYARHIVTIEDPIEYLFKNDKSYFSQREVHRDTGDFDIALRQALRQNPDVIFFGEIRDPESALAALRASETGHLVISTLHGSGVAGVPTSLERINRMITSHSTNTAGLLSQQIIGIMSQQLLPRIDGGLVAVLEYFSNAGITRKWISQGKFDELRDQINRSQDDDSCPFIRYLVAAVKQDIIDPQTARAACDRPQDLDRALRGIT